MPTLFVGAPSNGYTDELVEQDWQDVQGKNWHDVCTELLQDMLGQDWYDVRGKNWQHVLNEFLQNIQGTTSEM